MRVPFPVKLVNLPYKYNENESSNPKIIPNTKQIDKTEQDDINKWLKNKDYHLAINKSKNNHSDEEKSTSDESEVSDNENPCLDNQDIFDKYFYKPNEICYH